MRLRLGWLTPLLLLGCLDAFAPAGAVPFTPPAVYRAWWTEIESCAGLSGDFDRVEWYEVPGSSYSCPAYEGRCDGWWRSPHTTYMGQGLEASRTPPRRAAGAPSTTPAATSSRARRAVRAAAAETSAARPTPGSWSIPRRSPRGSSTS